MIEGQNEPDDATKAGDPPDAALAKSPKPDPLVGTVIHDRFRIIAPIARGGMGVVYKAEQAPLGRVVAMKILSPKHDEDKDPEFRKRFFLEAATVAKLTHPNTVTVFDYGQSEGLFFIVMEYLEGVTLKKAIRTDGAFPAHRAINVAKQICRSLREAHRLGVIHRDMKPGNIMLLEHADEPDYVKVLDFGLVKDIDKDAEEEDLTQAGVFMGSPKYMSPEQIQGERVDGRSDIYSLGVLLYEMLTGKPPFVRDKQVQVLMDHINAPVPAMTVPEGHPAIPPDLQRVTLKCLSKKRAERYDDMEQLLATLKMVESGVAMPSEETGPGYDLAVGTPVSGIHALQGDVMRSSSAGSIPPPGVTTSSGPYPGVSSTQSLAVSTSQAFANETPGNKMAMVLGALAFLAAAGIIFFVLDPFGGDDTGVVSPTPVAAQPDPEPEPQVDDVVPEPEPIASVLIELESTPSGAAVTIGGLEYGATPVQIELTGDDAVPGTELTFVFRRAGHRATTVMRVVPDDGQLEVNARLRRVRTGRAGRAPPRETPQENVTLPGYRDTPY